MTTTWRETMATFDGIRVLMDEPMAGHTTYKVGGAVDAFAFVEDVDALKKALAHLAKHAVPYIVVGKGSNVLFADQGYRGAVLSLSKQFQSISLHPSEGGDVLRVGAGLSITKLIRFIKAHRIAGLECLGGVPGTLGGAICMNAGTVMGEVRDALLRVEVVTGDGHLQTLEASELQLSYRHSELPANALIISAEFRTTQADAATFERLDHVLAYRKRTQPLQQPSCGSVFANPPGDHAGRLIEACGLKGRRLGDAQVSEKHANWIVNLGKARAVDVRGLIALCVEAVKERFDIDLRHEVQFLGDWGTA